MPVEHVYGRPASIARYIIAEVFSIHGRQVYVLLNRSSPLLSASSSGSLFRFFLRSLCPQLKGMDSAGSIELFLQQSVDHSVASGLHFGFESIRDYVQTEMVSHSFHAC